MKIGTNTFFFLYVWGGGMVLNATFNNMFIGEGNQTGVPGESHRPAASQ
jgi:hypothetical protein